MGVCCGILELGDVTAALLHCDHLDAGQCETSRDKWATAGEYKTHKRQWRSRPHLGLCGHCPNRNFVMTR